MGILGQLDPRKANILFSLSHSPWLVCMCVWGVWFLVACMHSFLFWNHTFKRIKKNVELLIFLFFCLLFILCLYMMTVQWCHGMLPCIMGLTGFLLVLVRISVFGMWVLPTHLLTQPFTCLCACWPPSPHVSLLNVCVCVCLLCSDTPIWSTIHPAHILSFFLSFFLYFFPHFFLNKWWPLF